MEHKLYMSLFSGEIYTVPEDEVDNLEDGQLPLADHPKENCPKCYGRGWTDRNSVTGVYSICKCLKKRIDFSALEKFTKKNN